MEIQELRIRLATNLKKIRKENNVSQFELAEKAELSEQTINSIEGHRLWPSDKTITKICAALDCDVFRLFLPIESVPKTDDEVYSEIKESVTLHIKALINETLDKVIRE